jgi:preprotein translocase subunit SecF
MNPFLDFSFYCLVLSIINFILIIYLWFFKKQKYYKIKEPNENFSLGSNSKLSNELQELKSTINKLKDKVESSSIEKINEKIKQLEIQLENIEKNSQQKLNENMINTKKEEVKKEYKEPKLIKKYAFIPFHILPLTF